MFGERRHRRRRRCCWGLVEILFSLNPPVKLRNELMYSAGSPGSGRMGRDDRGSLGAQEQGGWQKLLYLQLNFFFLTQKFYLILVWLGFPSLTTHTHVSSEMKQKKTETQRGTCTHTHSQRKNNAKKSFGTVQQHSGETNSYGILNR